MATILVTGAAGFIGYHTSAALLACGHKVIGIDNINDYYDISLKHERLSKLSNMGDSWVFHKVCISDREAVFSLLAGEHVDYIIHLAAQAGVRYSIEAPQAYIDANITGTGVNHYIIIRVYNMPKIIEIFQKRNICWSEYMVVNPCRDPG